MFLVDLRASLGKGLEIRPIKAMINHNTTEVFFDNLEVPAENLIGEEGQGFRYILDGMNAERILVGTECIGDGRWLLNKGVAYAKERQVFGRPIGQNQGVQFPLAQRLCGARGRRHDVPPRRRAVRQPGANAAPTPTWPSCSPSEATWHAADATFQTYGGFALRAGIRHRAQMARGRASTDRADLDQHGARLRRRSTCSACRAHIERGQMNGAESLVRTLVGGGVDVCFTNPGTSEMHFVAALDRVDGMRCVLCLFEGVATGAADGYARMAEKPAATLLHLGPGLGNGLANLHNARRARSPIVNIVGEHATYHRRASTRRSPPTSKASRAPSRTGSGPPRTRASLAGDGGRSHRRRRKTGAGPDRDADPAPPTRPGARAARSQRCRRRRPAPPSRRRASRPPPRR